MFVPRAFSNISSCFQEGSGSDAPRMAVGTSCSMSQRIAGWKSVKYRCSCGWAMKHTEGGTCGGGPCAAAARASSSSSAAASSPAPASRAGASAATAAPVAPAPAAVPEEAAAASGCSTSCVSPATPPLPPPSAPPAEAVLPPLSAACSPSAAAAGRGGASSLARASCRVPLMTRRVIRLPPSSWFCVTPCVMPSALGSGIRLLSGSSSPRKPTSTSSKLSTPGSRAISVLACNHRNSHVEDTPTNHMERWRVSAVIKHFPSTANSSMAHSTLLLKAMPQSLPSAPGASPRSKASKSTSSSVQRTPHLLRASERSVRLRCCSSLSSSPSFEKSFLRFFFCSRHCLVHSRSTSCCICLAAA
mmetsp:Transcript_41625/g.115891  ORF Transcript_41625/g.115891 Transcript_41625/m.115891 type:complete len:360 (+) Transcript_41625:298-1377(+)